MNLKASSNDDEKADWPKEPGLKEERTKLVRPWKSSSDLKALENEDKNELTESERLVRSWKSSLNLKTKPVRSWSSSSDLKAHENEEYDTRQVRSWTSSLIARDLVEEVLEEVKLITNADQGDCKECEELKAAVMKRNCQSCGEGVLGEEEELSMVGMDAVALFPSLSGKRTAEIVRERVKKSRLKLSGFNWRKAMIYIISNKHLVKKISKETRKFLPIRKSSRGTKPGMNSEGLKSKEGSEESQWFYPRSSPGEEVLKEIAGLVAEIGVRILWETYCYDFGGKTYLQKEGGPIGQRPTMAASRLVMQDFFEKYREILTEAGLKVFMMKVYVDDGRQVTTLLKKGSRYDKEEKKFKWSKEAESEDEQLELEGEDKNSFMARLCLPAMNGVNPDLTFTAEVEEDFPDKRLPTLDFSLWMRSDGSLAHTYYIFREGYEEPNYVGEGVSYGNKAETNDPKQ